MKFTSYTNTSRAKFEIDSEKYTIPDERKREFVSMFRRAKREMVAWDDNIQFAFTDEKNYYVLEEHFMGMMILVSYGVKNEKGRKEVEDIIPNEMKDMSKVKAPFVVDVLSEFPYAAYFMTASMRSNFDSASTGALTTLGGLLAFKGEI